ncbi:MAG TPA: CU044_5270 family protein [Solirubrobacterales bacterium]|nr:CU044_5270 family protein [Solirubrobacterales bacterium]
MDDLTQIRDFRAECAGDDPRARAAARRALEARFEMAGAVVRPARTRRRHRGLFALGGAVLAAAIVAAVIVVGSGSTASPAAAEVLRRAAVAAGGGRQPELPRPGQFFHARRMTVELEGWIPGGSSTGGGQLKGHGAFNALISKTTESWSGPDRTMRDREKMTAPPRFLSASERRRWQRAGSPLPGIFNPENQRPLLEAAARHDNQTLVARPGLFDLESTLPKGRGPGRNFGYPDASRLPTRPEALRRAIEHNRDPRFGYTATEKGGPLGDEETIYALWGLLSNPSATPALRAATFNALAELPGIELRTGAKDLAGREGDAIRYFEKSSGEAIEDIFDPATAEVLGDRWILIEPGKSPATVGLPQGLVIRANAYLGGKVVDSTRER